MSRNTGVFGIFKSHSELEAAIERLRANGFRMADISVLLPENQGTKELAVEKHTKAPEGATGGAGTGAVLGGAFGWLVGIGALAIPGLGWLVAAGPIVATLAGVGVGGSFGGLVGGLIGLGVPEYEAKRFEGYIKAGGILISVHADNSEWRHKAKTLLEEAGAHNIASAQEARADVPTQHPAHL